MFVLGSGGHTGEMISMIEHSILPKHGNTHRRYVVTAGEDLSVKRIEKMENGLSKRFEAHGVDGGTFDIYTIRRTRMVHQSFFTTPFTTAKCIQDVIWMLMASSPPALSQEVRQFPDVIVTNGPGTGFVISLIAYLLRMTWLIPAGKCKIVFIESFAKVRTLSMTGKLFHHLKIADRLIVQHPPLAEKYGHILVQYIVVVPPADPGQPANEPD